jgi:hypothetical protein
MLNEPTVVSGSGGVSAAARWTKGEQSIELHVRAALGIVDYVWGTDRFGHKDYLRVLDRVGAYPGFSADPIEPFEHLAVDLKGVASPVLELTEDEFHDIARRVRALPKPGLP